MLVPAKRMVPRAGAEEAGLWGIDWEDGARATESAGALSGALEHANTMVVMTRSAADRAPLRTPFPLPSSLFHRMLVARDLSKEYRSGENRLTVLRDVNFTIAQGAFVAIVGPSGSGKTTLLGLLAGLDTPSRGQVLLDDADLTAMDEDQRARLRGEKVGFVFQSFQLISTLTALENVQVPLELRGDRGAGARAKDLLTRVGLSDRLHHFPTQLSGGEQQRVAIARAFSNSPRILFADEPTGNLDSETGARIVALLESLNRESKTTIVLVTHDLALAAHAQRIIRLSDGRVISDSNTERAA
jgi:putative ABC transport system ATP-binding protein